MNRKSIDQQAGIFHSLCEGNSIRATARQRNCAINTVVKLLVELGPACSAFLDDRVRNLNSLVVQVDEIWSFVGCKQKNVKTSTIDTDHLGDIWTWTAIDADSKLIITWNVGPRDPGTCRDFIDDLADRCSKRIQLSSDGFGTYRDAVRIAFGKNVDYGQVIKSYGVDPTQHEVRYSPSVCTGCKTVPVVGDPIESQISTSYVERHNLTMRMGMRRFTRLTNGHSKKLANHVAAQGIFFAFYNFCRSHETLTKGAGFKTTPAMAAGLTDHVWSVEELIAEVSK